MPYMINPMENFNRSNPFVILSKREYDSLMDDLQKTAKNGLAYSIAIVMILIIGIIISFVGVRSGVYTISTMGLANGISIFFTAIMIVHFYLILDRYQNKNPFLIEFEKIANASFNDIVDMSSEDVLKGLHSLYRVRGQLEIEKWYLNTLFQLVGVILVMEYTYFTINIVRAIL